MFRRLLADQITPVGAFQRIARGTDRAFLLESVVGGEQIARYSFIGAAPSAVFRAQGDIASIERTDGSVEVLNAVADPLGELRKLLDDRAAAPYGSAYDGLVTLPRFTGGAVGYAGYDTIRYYENLPNPPADDRGLDDLDFGIYDRMVIFDHVNKTILVVAQASLDGGGAEAAYADACRRIDELVARLSQPSAGVGSELNLDASPVARFDSSFARERYEDAVRKSIDYILAGDIFQVVLSQRLRVPFAAEPFDIYRALRVVNPSPFMFYLKSPRCILVGASPEILCRVEDGVITNRPLAGTRHRGSSVREDADLERQLLADPKDRAEHIMLVDLGRNDVGRVAEPGSIRLSNVMSVERYSHVMHISSTVTGKLAAGRTAMDALRTSLPVGTVSGAPKIRAMQIIDELEPVRRGPYAGAVGYFDFSGNMDTCIALRTMVITPAQGPGQWLVDIQAGAGIVADSRPAAEYQETLNKARALLTAVAIAQDRS
ncbi:MAG TPA: anthranilate synthase component I [Phycisphaerae bacterium]|nr:anthranilate synthase component I [Phycisphaerae bacterium]